MVFALCRGDERLIRVGSGLHLVGDEASQGDACSVNTLEAGPRNGHQLARASACVRDPTRGVDGCVEASWSTRNRVLDIGHATGKEVGNDRLSRCRHRPVVGNDGEGHFLARSCLRVRNGRLCVVVRGTRGLKQEDVTEVIRRNTNGLSPVFGLHRQVGHAVLDANPRGICSGLPCI